MTNLRLKGEAGIDYDDWRECHYCAAHFKPDTPSRYHCSEVCAAACLVKRNYGMGPKPQPVEPVDDVHEGE